MKTRRSALSAAILVCASPTFAVEVRESRVRVDIRVPGENGDVRIGVRDLQTALRHRQITVGAQAFHYQYITGSADMLRKAREAAIQLYGKEAVKVWQETPAAADISPRIRKESPHQGGDFPL